MGRLTELQRQVLEYRFAAGLTGAEIAVLLGRKENAIKQLQHAAIVRLRHLLAEERHAPPAESSRQSRSSSSRVLQWTKNDTAGEKVNCGPPLSAMNS